MAKRRSKEWIYSLTRIISKREPPATTEREQPATTEPVPFYESTLVWGAFGIVITFVSVYLGFALKDIRWFLAAAWPFCIVTFAGIAKSIHTQKRVHAIRLAFILVGGTLSAVVMWRLSVLIPPPQSPDISGQISDLKQQISGAHEKFPTPDKPLSKGEIRDIVRGERAAQAANRADPFIDISNRRLDEMSLQSIRDLDDLVDKWSSSETTIVRGYYDDLWLSNHPLSDAEKVAFKNKENKLLDSADMDFRKRIQDSLNEASAIYEHVYVRLLPSDKLAHEGSHSQFQNDLATLRSMNCSPGDLHRLEDDLKDIESLFKKRIG